MKETVQVTYGFFYHIKWWEISPPALQLASQAPYTVSVVSPVSCPFQNGWMADLTVQEAGTKRMKISFKIVNNPPVARALPQARLGELTALPQIF